MIWWSGCTKLHTFRIQITRYIMNLCRKCSKQYIHGKINVLNVIRPSPHFMILSLCRSLAVNLACTPAKPFLNDDFICWLSFWWCSSVITCYDDSNPNEFSGEESLIWLYLVTGNHYEWFQTYARKKVKIHKLQRIKYFTQHLFRVSTILSASIVAFTELECTPGLNMIIFFISILWKQ